MPITVNWADEHHTIVCYTIDGRWNWDDWYTVFSEGKALVRSVDHRVDVIVDTRNTGWMPPDIVTHVLQVTNTRSKNLHLAVIVTRSSTARTLYAVASRIHHRIRECYALADSVEEARRIIDQARLSEPRLEYR